MAPTSKHTLGKLHMSRSLVVEYSHRSHDLSGSCQPPHTVYDPIFQVTFFTERSHKGNCKFQFHLIINASHSWTITVFLSSYLDFMLGIFYSLPEDCVASETLGFLKYDWSFSSCDAWTLRLFCNATPCCCCYAYEHPQAPLSCLSFPFPQIYYVTNRLFLLLFMCFC